MKPTYRIIVALLLLVLLQACKKDEKNILAPEPVPQLPEQKPPVLTVSFEARVGNKKLVPYTRYYANAAGDSFTVTKFNYYITNLKFTRQDGSVFVEPESYHLIRHLQGETTFTVSAIPAGIYTNIEFLIGVDSLRNVSGSQTGALDPSLEMFWEWNTGYRFFVMEGNYTSPTVEKQDYAIHIGGFSGEFNCLQNYYTSFNDKFELKNNQHGKINFIAHVEEVFKNPVTLGFDDYYNNIGLSMFRLISINYKDMFSISNVENE